MSSRRNFLQQGAGAVGALCLGSLRVGSLRCAPSFFSRGSGAAAGRSELALRLFFDDSDLQRMRNIYASDESFESLRIRLNAVDRDGLRRFMKSEVRYNDQLFDIVRLSDAAEAMSFHFAMTGDREAAALAADCIRSIMKFDRWDYFLEAGKYVIGIQRASSTMIAVAVCADWLGDTIDDEERGQWLSVMQERGCETCFRSLYGMRYPDTVVGWTRDETSTYFEHRPEDRPTDLSRRHIILDNTNLKAVPASALAIGAMACRQQLGPSADTARWLEQAVYSLGTFRDFFEPDGSYPEGVSYANYTALNILKATSVLKRFDVADLTELINWVGFADFVLEMSMPTADDPFGIVNFGDNGNAKTGTAGRPQRTAVSLWVASTFFDHRAQWFGLNLGGIHDEWALIWYNPDLVPESPPDGPRVWRSDLDWIVARDGFAAENLVVAMRSGGPGNHEHADRNSIIVKAYGEELVVDPYRPPYSFTDPKWMMRTTAGHSAVLVDAHGHQYHDGTEGTNSSNASARIIRSVERRGYAWWTSDATEAYSLVDPDIGRITRTVLVHFGYPVIIVFDKLIKRSKTSVLQARWFGYNHDGVGVITADGTTFKTERPGAILVGATASNAGTRIQSMTLPIPEDEAVKHPFAEVSTIAPSLSPVLVTALMPSPMESRVALPRADIKQEEGVYRISILHGMTEFRCVFHDGGAVPEVELGGTRE